MTTNGKITRGIVASTSVDSHGDQMTLEALANLVERINNPEVKLRFGIDHRPDFPPKGIVTNAALIEKDGYYVAEADFCEFEECNVAGWDKTLVIESFSTPLIFIEVESAPVDTISVSIDPHNFSSEEDYQSYLNKVEEATDVEAEMHESLRKSELPIPEITFTLTGSVLAYQLLKPTMKKVGEKIADKVSEAVIETGERAFVLIETALKEAFYKLIPKTRPVTTIFNYPGKPHIQLIAKTRGSQVVLNALNKISNVLKEIDDLKKNVDVAKIQFILNNKGKWKFNYLLTSDGKSIGKKTAIEKREKEKRLYYAMQVTQDVY